MDFSHLQLDLMQISTLILEQLFKTAERYWDSAAFPHVLETENVNSTFQKLREGTIYLPKAACQLVEPVSGHKFV